MVLARLNEQDGYVYLITGGLTYMSFADEDGREFVHFIGTTGYVFGMRACILNKPYNGSLHALTEVTYYKIPFELVRRTMREDDDFYQTVMMNEFERGIKYTRKVEILSIPTIKGRVSVVLLSLANLIGKISDGKCVINIKLTHEFLAKLVYSDRVSVSRAISSLKKSGDIEEKSGIYKILPDGELAQYIKI